MKLKDIKVIGFDLDGTLYPLTDEIQKKIRARIYRKISSEFDISYEQARNSFELEYEKILSGSRTIEIIAKQLNKPLTKKDFVQEAIEETDVLDLIEENLKLERMLLRLKNKKSLDLLTGSPYFGIFKKLKKLKINPNLFENIFTREDGLKYLDLYNKWIGKQGFCPENFLYIGDNKKQDIDIPKALGIKTCFLGEYNNADFEIKDILDLESLF